MKFTRMLSLAMVLLSFILILFAILSLGNYYRYDPILGNADDFASYAVAAAILSLLSMCLSAVSFLIERHYVLDTWSLAIVFVAALLIIANIFIFTGAFILT